MCISISTGVIVAIIASTIRQLLRKANENKENQFSGSEFSQHPWRQKQPTCWKSSADTLGTTKSTKHNNFLEEFETPPGGHFQHSPHIQLCCLCLLCFLVFVLRIPPTSCCACVLLLIQWCLPTPCPESCVQFLLLWCRSVCSVRTRNDVLSWSSGFF